MSDIVSDRPGPSSEIETGKEAGRMDISLKKDDEDDLPLCYMFGPVETVELEDMICNTFYRAIPLPDYDSDSDSENVSVSEVRRKVNRMDICSPVRECYSEIRKELKVRRMEPPIPFTYCNNLSRVILVDDKNDCGRYPRVERGTTTLAFIFKHGIMFAADHSSELSILNMIEVNSRIISTVSGGSEYLLTHLQRKCCNYEGEKGRRISVAEAAMFLAMSVYPSLSTGGLLIGGWDEEDPVLYHINRLGDLENVKEKRTLKGTQLEWIRYATGSGARGANVYLDIRMKYDMTVAEAAELAKAAICFASYQATEIGDFVSVYHLGKNGCEKPISGHSAKEWQNQNLANSESSVPVSVSIYPPELYY